MNRIGKLFQLVLGVTLAAFAMSAMAAPPPKKFDLSASNPAPLRISVMLTNSSPGNSSFNSFSLSFSPSLTIVGAGITLQHSGTSTPNWTPNVSTPGLLTITNLSPVGKNQTVTVTFAVSTCTSTPVTVTARAFTGSSLTGEEFNDPLNPASAQTTVGCDTVLACSGTTLYTEPSGGNLTTIERLGNKDGSTCQPVAFNVLFTDSDKTVQVQWDEATHSAVVLKTTIDWPLKLVATLPEGTLKVAWGGSTPTYIPAPACLSTEPPSPTFTPLPMLGPDAPPPYTNTRARVCILYHHFTIVNPELCSPQGINQGCVQIGSQAYIVGDPWLSIQ